MTTFSLCPKLLLEAKQKKYGLMALSGEISRQHAIGCVMWLLASLTQIYNEVRQREIQNVLFGEKVTTWEFNIRTKSYIQREAKFKERLDLKWNKGSGIFRTRPHSAKLPP